MPTGKTPGVLPVAGPRDVGARPAYGRAMALRFAPAHELDEIPHVVVDGGPIASTALTLSHWPGSPTPVELLDDLSAQIVFHALRRPELFDGIEVVTNNHFDQDGLAGVFGLVDPQTALTLEERLVDLARAGDFGTFEHRDSIRLAFVLAAWDDEARSPLDQALLAGTYEERCGRLYTELVPRVPELLADVDALRPWWEHEDAHLDESLRAIDSGVVRIADRPDLDLAVVEVPDAWAERTTTRFTVGRSDAVHPSAIANRTERLRVATVQAGRYRLECRYETWVMFRSRPVMPRPDLRPIASRLHELDPSAGWVARAPSALTPTLSSADESELSPDAWLSTVTASLATAPPAWDPVDPSW